MKKKFETLISIDEQRRQILDVLRYYKTEGVVVEPKRGYYRLKTKKEIKKELADICKE